MGKGLKDQWGVKDPAKAGSDKQAQEFEAKFKAEIARINPHLQYTSANAPAASHDPLAARRDALYAAFQSALGQIDKTDPSKAKGAIDKVLADAKALETETAKLHTETQKAKHDWQTRQPKFDAAVHQVEELEAWGDAKAAPLRTLVDAIRTKVNERDYAQASATVDQLLPKLKPIYENYQKQKVAKPKYEQMHAEQTARLEPLKTVERPAQSMTAKQQEAEAALQQAEAKANEKDYVAAEDQMKIAKAAVDAFDKMAKDPARAKFLVESKAAEELVKTPADVHFAALDADWNAIVQLREQAEAAGNAGDYAGANGMFAQLKTKHAAWKTRLEETKKAKAEFEAGIATLQPQLDEAAAAKPYKILKEKLDAITALQTTMKTAATAEDFTAAVKAMKELKPKVEAFLPEAKAQEAAETEFTTTWATLKPKLENEALLSTRTFAPLKNLRNALMKDRSAIVAAEEAQDYAKGLPILQKLGPKVDDYIAKAEAEEEKIKKKGEEITKKLDGASEATKGDVAKAITNKLSPDEIKGLPSDVRNRLLTEMQKGGLTDGEKNAIKHMFSQRFLDPEFEKLDNKNREKLIEKLKNDPDMKAARKDWDTMTEAQRLAVLKKVADAQADAYGIAKTDVVPYNPVHNDGTPNDDELGVYNDSDGKLKMSSHALQTEGFDSMLDTVVHENGHRYQVTLAKGLDKTPPDYKPGDPLYQQAQTFKVQEGYYIQPKDRPRDRPTPDTGDEYFTQPDEYHSRRTGAGIVGAGIGK